MNTDPNSHSASHPRLVSSSQRNVTTIPSDPYPLSPYQAIERQSELFFDESWLVLNCYVLSHEWLPLRWEKRKRYLRIAKALWTRYLTLVPQGETQHIGDGISS